MDAMPSFQAAERSFFSIRRWLIVAALAGVVLWHAHTTWAAFAGSIANPLTSPDPICSGRHPLHHYHAAIAAESLSLRSRCSCYDPYHAAGYAHTDGVDFDARPYVPFLLGSTRESVASRYKLALFVLWTSIPLWFWAAARVARCSSVGAIIAAALAGGLAGAAPGRSMFENGDLGQALSAAVAVVHMSFLVRCHSQPTLASFAGLLATAGIGWCLQPLIWGGVWLLSFGCWLGMFRRHSLRWHSAFGIAQGLAVAIALPWLAEWVRHWWLTVPIRSDPQWAQSDYSGTWPAWASESLDRAVGIGLVLCGFIGGLLRRSGRRPRPMQWMVWSSLAVTLAVVASSWIDVLAPFAAPGYLFLGLGLAIIPAAHGVFRLARWMWLGSRRRWALASIFAATMLIAMDQSHFGANQRWGLSPLKLGLPPDLQKAIRAVAENTHAAGRVLWEESSGDADRISALLPLFVDRQFLVEAGEPENWHAVLHDGRLCGRSLAHWTDVELESFCRRYNVGWWMACTDFTAARLNRWAAAQLICDLGNRRLYAIRRPFSFILKGSARSFEADRHRITLGDVVPEHGEIVLSLHYHESLRARPGWVQVEREPDPFDPVPFIRLRMTAPAARVTLTWEPR